MRTFSIPQTDFRPSVIGLGTGHFGSAISASDSFCLLDEYAVAGGNFLDTAHVYASWLPNGEGKSETTIGQWLKKSGRRSNMIVATKGGHYDPSTPNISRATPECINRDIQESLERLQIDTIDLYFLHRDNPAIPAGEFLDALQPHLRAGRLSAIGASNWSPARLQSAAEYALTHGLTGFCCSQCGWSLAEANPSLQGEHGIHYIQEEALPYYRATGFPLIGFGSQAQGFFAQTWSWPGLDNPNPKQEALRPTYYSEKNVVRWQRARNLAQKRGCSINSIALGYLTNQPFPSAALIGPQTLIHLRESLAAADLVLSPDEITFLEEDAPPAQTKRQGLSAQTPA
jgi:aryl-alcohol dehydrogenase-like predicted oxidoreductase